MTRTLVFGAARSGKSAYAERQAQQSAADGRQVVYLATAAAGDAEMQARIEHHRQRRPSAWRTVEQPLHLGAAIQEYSNPDAVLLIDCLTVWLSNLLFSEARDYPEIGQIVPPPAFMRERESLLQALQQARGDVILVSNEVGMGIVPNGAISRWFVDESGRLNQAVAGLCEQVRWVAAGLPLALKGPSC